MAEELFRPFEAVGDRPIGEMEPAGGLAAVASGVEEHLECLDQFIAHPRVRQERAELALDNDCREVRVAQEEALDPEGMLRLSRGLREHMHIIQSEGESEPQPISFGWDKKDPLGMDKPAKGKSGKNGKKDD